MLDLNKELMKTEIKVKAENALADLNKANYNFHVLYRAIIDEDEENFWPFKDWDFNSLQNLTPVLESLRATAEQKINQELWQKFGQIPEATVYFICSEVMTEKVFIGENNEIT